MASYFLLASKKEDEKKKMEMERRKNKSAADEESISFPFFSFGQRTPQVEGGRRGPWSIRVVVDMCLRLRNHLGYCRTLLRDGHRLQMGNRSDDQFYLDQSTAVHGSAWRMYEKVRCRCGVSAEPVAPEPDAPLDSSGSGWTRRNVDRGWPLGQVDGAEPLAAAANPDPTENGTKEK
jgi:hypothetical protein